MNKNISINISGIIFHIDENAYEELKKYLDSIHHYFASFEGSNEIVADIESRIAEIFLDKLTDNKQVIALEDVESLKITMGSVKDFQAAEEEIKGQGTGGYDSNRSYERSAPVGEKRLYRDVNRRILSGVAAGIAYYFKIDPLWIRLILILLAVASYGVAIIIYIILWIVLPENTILPDNHKIKKMYRDPKDKVLGGVSSGIAAYFGVDTTFIRLLFIIFAVIGGSGLIAYIILWIILPEAKSLTERMQMQGDPITLSNIENNIRKSLDVKQDEEENLLLKIVLFPFRLIAAIFNGLGSSFGPLVVFLVEFIRIVAGLSLIIIGFILMLSLLIIAGLLAGIWPLINLETTWLTGIPIDVISNTFPLLTAIAVFFLIAIPSLFILLAGASIMAKRFVFNAPVGWTLFAIFFISLITASFTIPVAIANFQEKGEYQIVQTYNLGDRTSVIKLKEVGWDNYDVTDLEILGHEGPEYRLVQVFKARGSSRKEAAENARMVNYNVKQQDSTLIFDSNIQFKEGATFRFQQLEMKLYVPFESNFIMDRSIRHILEKTLYQKGYSVRDLENNRWIFTEKDGLACITCVGR